MPLLETKGAASAQGFGMTLGGAAPTYIEDVFSTWLYTGNGSTQTITNGIDLAGKGGLVWTKTRNVANSNWFIDTVRGGTQLIRSNTTEGQFTSAGTSITFGSSSYTVGSGDLNTSTQTQVSWTFRKQPKFFDVVTYTGDGTSNRPVAHSLASVPGCIIIKSMGTVTNWMVWHRSLSTDNLLTLNSTAAQANYATLTIHDVTSTNFQVDNYSMLNASGVQYVAYLFAHNAGGFGDDGLQNVISCGSYTGTGAAGNFVTLGYEPQWLLIKRTNTTGNWLVLDNMRGIATGGVDAGLFPNLSNAEDSTNDYLSVNATGFELTGVSTTVNASGSTYIYIAIRRGPMKTPTSGTSVFSPIVSTASTGTALTTGFPVDMQFPIALAPTYTLSNAVDRLRGVSSTTTASGKYLEQSNTNAEASGTVTRNWGNTGFEFPDYFATLKTLFLSFKRSPGFFDVVCYTGTGVARTVNHNLGVAPELVFIKQRSSTGGSWFAGSQFSGIGYNYSVLNSASSGSAFLYTDNVVYSAAPTSTLLNLSNSGGTNGSTQTYVAYLFASCPGVSKVGSYTGTGTTQQINCGFTGGARFVLIKRTDSTGDWYVWDSARGIVAGNDPYLLLNSTAAEVTSTDYVDTYSAGFEISSTAPAAINANGGTFIFLAIA